MKKQSTKNTKSNSKNSSSKKNKSSGSMKQWLSKLVDLGEDSKFDDIVEALKTDHDNLRELGKTLKSEDASTAEKKETYQNFSSLLKSHAKSEEKAVYDRCHSVKDMTQEVDEGFVEHNIADTLMKNIAATKNKDKWTAMVKVLAEVVEHHADEEEKEMLPDLQKEFEKSDQASMSHQFITLREKSQTGVNEDNAGILAEVHSAQQAVTAAR